MAVSEVDDQGAKVNDPAEIIEPSVPERVQVIGREDYTFTFVQKPLSFIGKIEFFAVLGRALDRAMSGPDGLSLAELFDELPDDPELFRLQDLKEQNTLVHGLAKLIAFAPEILVDLYCVALAVPKGRRTTVKQVMEMPEAEGGLSDKDGIAILDTFLEQNWEVLVDFFKGPAKDLLAKLAAKAPKKPAQKSASSKPSKSSPQSTDGQ